MYGVLIVGVQHYIETYYGAPMWPLVVVKSGLGILAYQTQRVYSESVIERLLEALSEETGRSVDEVRYQNGLFFAAFTSEYGYEKLLRVQGRTFVDFLRNLDNLHEHLRFSYPKIRPPSFFILSQSDKSIRLVYSSKRLGYEHYVRGQLVTLAKRFFNLNITVRLVSKLSEGLVNHTTYELTHDGKTWGGQAATYPQVPLPDWEVTIRSSDFFHLISFFIVLTPEMVIRKISEPFKLLDITLEGSPFSDKFLIGRPYVEADFDEIKLHRHNTFELVLIAQAENLSELRDTKQLAECGLFISDLNMFDRSRDIIMSGDQQSDELMKLFKKQLEESKQLEKSMKRVDKMRKMTDGLLYQCIPRAVARKLRNGTPAMETIQTFDSVSICFTKVVNFGAKCMQISVEQIIGLLNQMYTLYDALTESHKVYKVETIGDSYMLVSGAPQQTPLHTAHIIEMALHILETTQKSLYWPEPGAEVVPPESTTLQGPNQEPLQLFIGCHTGPIVAGVVGYKTPRYCLFGDTVNTSSRMMSNSQGKGEMETFFVLSRDLEFSFLDSDTGNRQNFADVLKEDFERGDDTPSDGSISEESISLELSEDYSEEMDSVMSSSRSSLRNQPIKKRQSNAKPPLIKSPATIEEEKTPTHQAKPANKPADSKHTNGVAQVSKTAQVATPPGQNKPNGTTVKETSETDGKSGANEEVRSRKLGMAAPTVVPPVESSNTNGGSKPQSTRADRAKDAETTKVLNEAAKRLVTTKTNTHKLTGDSARQSVTFAPGKPTEIPTDACKSDSLTEANANGNCEGSVDRPETPRGSPEKLERRNSNSNGKSLALRSMEENGGPRRPSHANGSTVLANGRQGAKGKFDQMVQQKLFQPMQLIPLRSPNAVILREVDCGGADCKCCDGCKSNGKCSCQPNDCKCRSCGCGCKCH